MKIITTFIFHFLLLIHLASCEKSKNSGEWTTGRERPSNEVVDRWIEQARDHRDGEAALSLSVYYSTFEQDQKTSTYWFLKAVDFGNKTAKASVPDPEKAWQLWRDNYEKDSKETEKTD